MFHNIHSFIKTGFKEKTTWIAILLCIAFWYYHKDIDLLIHNIFGSDKAVEVVLGVIVPAMLLVWTKKKDNE